MKNYILPIVLGLALSIGATAQTTTDKPQLRTYTFDDGAIISGLSDNGKWAAFSGTDADNPLIELGAKLVNIDEGTTLSLTEGLDADTVQTSGASDVSDDGNIVVGQLNGHPAYYTVSTGKWTYLELPSTATSGGATRVTPDGHYAVGSLSLASGSYDEGCALWDLTTGKIVATPGIPTKDTTHEDQKQNRFIGISPDGTKVLGCMSYSYLPTAYTEGGIFYYVYDVTTATYKAIGFTPSDDSAWTPADKNLLFISDASMSANGEYVTGMAYIYKSDGESTASDEYYVPFRYNVNTEEFVLYNDKESHDMAGWLIDAEGNVIAAGPAENPYRYFSVRSGDYWVDFTETMKQVYNYDLTTAINSDNSGTPVVMSGDGLRIASLIGDGTSYIITLPETFATSANKINLLSSYTATPEDGSTISRVKTVKVTFTRNVQFIGQGSDVKIYSITGEEVESAISAAVDGTDPASIIVTFRRGNFPEADMPYEVVIPAKTICLSGDAKRYNDEIRLLYQSRANEPMKVSATSPKEDGYIGKLDMNTSPVTFTFDANIALANTSARAELYQSEVAEPFAELMLSVSGNKLYAYPTTVQYLYKDVDYKIVLPAGVVTDVAGNTASANEAFTLNIHGSYEREISYDSNILYSEDFASGVSGMLLYDGDGNTPDSESQTYSFLSSGDEYAWVPVRDNSSSTDYAAASTSMYSPSGASDDWMVTPQVNIVDKMCTLTFKSQSFYNAKTDTLEVYVWPSNNIYNSLSDDVVSQMKKEATLVYKEIQSPGENEQTLAGDWKENTVDLSAFAGKNVYIAFVNHNEAQSLIFVDDIQVTHNLPFYAAFTNEDKVVGKESIEIAGNISIRDEQETFTTLALTLKDAAGNVVDQISESGLSLSKGNTYAFAFSKPLPLTIGKENAYTVDFKLNDRENTVSKSVKDLSFQPNKHVILEEYTGMDCGNCPLGILGIEYLEKRYGDLFIPMALHCYGTDVLTAGVSAYNSYLGMNAAPTGRIQRRAAAAPMAENSGVYGFEPVSDDMSTWLADVRTEMETPAEAEISATATLNASNTSYTVPVTLRYSLNAEHLNLKLFAVLLENGVVGYQDNYLYSRTSENLGEWQMGGKYGKSKVSPYTFDHVVRGWSGETFTGTPDLFPTEITAGEEYSTTVNVDVPETVINPYNTEVVVVLFDGNTDKVINACKAKSTADGIGNIETDAANGIAISVADGKVTVIANGETTATLTSADGRTLATESGNGILTLNPGTMRGVAVVKAVTSQGTMVKKVVL